MTGIEALLRTLELMDGGMSAEEASDTALEELAADLPNLDY